MVHRRCTRINTNHEVCKVWTLTNLGLHKISPDGQLLLALAPQVVILTYFKFDTCERFTRVTLKGSLEIYENEY